MAKLLPILLAVIGIGAGIGAGVFLRPDPAETVHSDAMTDCPASHEAESTHENTSASSGGSSVEAHQYVKLNNQFVVPIVTDDLVDALVVMSLSIEIDADQTETIYAREPKLRDALLQVLFDHANIGGFHGEFTNANNMDILRRALTDTARNIVGEVVVGILITDIARQDV